MADKVVILNGKTLVHGQGVKESIEKSGAESTVCFDEVITDGTDVVSYKLDIDRLVFETRQDYVDLRNILNKMMKTPGTITTRETIRYKNSKPWTIVKNYNDCILDGKDWEMKAEEKTAQSLSFVCGSMDEYTENA